jgi:membrane-associated phospholipid phosphatase
MLEQLIQIDRNIFFLINNGLQNPFFDLIMPLLRSKYFWAPLYLFLIAFFIVNYQKKGLVVIGMLLLTFALTDFVSAGIFKQFFQRLRPCNDPDLILYVKNIVGCGSGFSFVSSHAANHFGIAIFLAGFFKDKIRWIAPAFITWAVVISFAQVYVGVHYPFDVICGAVLGIIIGNLTIYLYHKIQQRI